MTTHSSLGRYSCEPTIFIGTRKINKEDKLALYFTAFILEQVQGKAPISGSIVDVAGKLHKTKLVEETRSLLPVLEPLQEWLIEDVPEEPPVILNKHCPLCQFRNSCRTRAKQENNLSLLARVTPRIIRQYGKTAILIMGF